MDRPPGWSVRLKLTLSYAGFLMLASVLLLATVGVFLLRYVPDGVLSTPAPAFPARRLPPLPPGELILPQNVCAAEGCYDTASSPSNGIW